MCLLIIYAWRIYGTKTVCAMLLEGTKAANQKCSVKKVFFEILQTSQGNTCAGVFFLINLQKTKISRKFLIPSFLQNTSGGCFWKQCSVQYVMKSLLDEVKQHCFIISEKRNTNIVFLNYILIITWTRLNTDFFPHWNLQKEVIVESDRVIWCDMRCCTKIGKFASFKSSMNSWWWKKLCFTLNSWRWTNL